MWLLWFSEQVDITGVNKRLAKIQATWLVYAAKDRPKYGEWIVNIAGPVWLGLERE